MKRLKTILLFLVICISCFGQKSANKTNTNNQRVIWEYIEIKVEGSSLSKYGYNTPDFSNQTGMLNLMGSMGWELVNVYTETATEFPSFGSNGVIGSNTKTQIINFVFKRPKSEK